jgi:predicted DNA-binding transcriptional regulator YafY
VTVKIKFLPAAARYVLESQWHDSQKLTKQRDGSLLAEFHLSDTEEIKRWVYSFGSSAIVLEPESLRAQMAQELAATLRAYGEEPATGKPVSRRAK